MVSGESQVTSLTALFSGGFRPQGLCTCLSHLPEICLSDEGTAQLCYSIKSLLKFSFSERLPGPLIQNPHCHVFYHLSRLLKGQLIRAEGPPGPPFSQRLA